MPSNVTTISDAKASEILSQLRNESLSPRAVRELVRTLTATLTKHVLKPQAQGEQIAVIVILRSGLAMADAFLDALPEDADAVTYHIGLFREKESLRPVEYYNKLPIKSPKITRAYILDPLVATGGTATAAMDILRDWGIQHITLFSLLGSKEGIEKVAGVWPENSEIYVAAIDDTLDKNGYVRPGLGDIGDRLFGTKLE
ncbi:uracil phosphoribosyltransferase-domain-containing protein [Aspergillus cavernicola]|uniref:uracil phosphoribosyltransferase n=1 Tax=Aspergillus cavernicola TaxID=176166 RepID=A0ABR4I0M2_9EURO